MRDIQNRNEWLKKAYRDTKQFLIELRSVPCTDCGIQYDWWIMEFDHTRGIKKFNVTSCGSKNRKSQALLDEIEKCDVVCANCHSNRTYVRNLK